MRAKIALFLFCVWLSQGSTSWDILHAKVIAILVALVYVFKKKDHVRILQDIELSILYICSSINVREEPIMIWGGGTRAKAGKKTQRLLAQGKKTQLNNLEEKKNSTQQPGKKIQQQVGQEKKLNSRLAWKKTQHEFSAHALPPRSLMVRP